MAEVSYKGKSFEVDEDGFLLRFDEWCPEWLEYVKDSEGISELNEDHQKILDFLQDYYRKNGIAPMVRILSKNTGYKLKEVYELFPSGPGKGACKMAGLPKPTGCVQSIIRFCGVQEEGDLFLHVFFYKEKCSCSTGNKFIKRQNISLK